MEVEDKLRLPNAAAHGRVTTLLAAVVEKGFVGLGGFGDVRTVYEWKGLKLEVDETMYGFGTCYEIECESTDPEGVKKVLETFLKENGIEYSYSDASKFAVFRSGKLPK